VHEIPKYICMFSPIYNHIFSLDNFKVDGTRIEFYVITVVTIKYGRSGFLVSLNNLIKEC
jgi:hypothetical protein